MKLIFHKKFKRRFKKLTYAQQKKVTDRFTLFVVEPFDPILHNHELSGPWKGYRSINITGDLRAVYTIIDDGIVRFVDIGTHSELYE